MFYKLVIVSIFTINTINIVSATSCINDNLSNSNSLSNLFTKDELSNQNSSSLNSIASTNSNTSGNRSESIESQEQNSNSYGMLLINSPYSSSQQEDSCIISIQNDISNIKIIDNKSEVKIKYKEDIINKYFQENCPIENLDIKKGRKYLLKLYNEFERISESNNNKTPIDKINNRFCLMVNIACSFIKVNKLLELNNNITDEKIEDIENLSYNLYYENGLFTKDIIIRYFNSYKESLLSLLPPLVDFYN